MVPLSCHHVLLYCPRSYVGTEHTHDKMLSRPPVMWDKVGAEWDLLVESYCFCDPEFSDYCIPKARSAIEFEMQFSNDAI